MLYTGRACRAQREGWEVVSVYEENDTALYPLPQTTSPVRGHAGSACAREIDAILGYRNCSFSPFSSSHTRLSPNSAQARIARG